MSGPASSGSSQPVVNTFVNSLGQPVGFPLSDWVPAVTPTKARLTGRYCELVGLDAEQHGADLYAANSLDVEQRMWTYLPYGPFASFDEYRVWLRAAQQSTDPLYFAVIDPATQRAVGVVSYLRIDPKNGVIEVGHLAYSPHLQRTPAATECMYLLMKYAFELGYRRYEWKCDALNAPSRAAAERLGFQYEGLFRQAVIYKQRSRDTTWYSLLDRDWPSLRPAFERWLAPSNFNEKGEQLLKLSHLTAHARAELL